MYSRIALCLLAMWLPFSLLTSLSAGENEERAATLRLAAEKGLSLVQKAAARYPEHRECFSCHHQTLPLLAMREAERSGLTIDQEVRTNQTEFTLANFTSRKEKLEAGEGIGGKSFTVSFGLWTLDIVDHKPDAISTAMVQYLLKTQLKEGNFPRHSLRPPLEESLVTVAVLSAYYAQEFADEKQKDTVQMAIERTVKWLDQAPLKVTEDYAMRLWGLKQLGGSAEEIETARDAFLALQREDGGWAQRPDMKSDAYSTGQALFVLSECGVDPKSDVVQKGIDYLLKTQHPDGSWLVETHSKPVQQYFDNGDPHGKHQFISTPATAWAVVAICRQLESKK